MPPPFAAYSRRQLFEFSFVILSSIWTAQIYSAVGNHPSLAWLYPPLIFICSLRFAVYASGYMLALVANDMTGGKLPVAEVGLALQATEMAAWAWRGILLRRLPEDSTCARMHHWICRAARPIFVAAAIVLAASVLFRRTEAVWLLWAACLFTVSWVIRSPRWPGWIPVTATTALTIISIVPAIAVLEIGCRFFFPTATPNKSITVYHPSALWTLGANASGNMMFGSSALGEPFEMSSYSVSISSQGLRDREFGPKEPGEFRVLLLGDSFTFGWGLEIDKTISRQLESYLNAAGTAQKFTVINAGVDGYGPWQERVRLREIGLALEPDLVILQLFPPNDIDNSLGKIGKRTRSFDPAWEHLMQSRRHWETWQVRGDDWLRKHSAFYNQLAHVFETPSPLIEFLDSLRFVRRATPKLPKSEPRPFWLELHLKDWYPELVEGRAIMEADTLAIRDDCTARGVAFLLYAVPDLNSVCDYAWNWNMKEEVDDPSLYTRGKDLEIMREFCARGNIGCIDLGDAMRTHASPCKLYYEADGHLTPAGAALAAQTIGEYVLENADVK